MAYIFVDDGAPEAWEYDTNYIFFDENDPKDRERALLEAERRRRRVQELQANLPSPFESRFHSVVPEDQWPSTGPNEA